MVSCGNSNTGSKEPELGVLDLLIQQDNFGDADNDGISDDFGSEYNIDDSLKPPLSHYPDGTCVKDILTEEEIQEEIDDFEKGSDHSTDDGTPPVEIISLGCTNPDALNYDPDAVEDDGSCTFPPVDPPPTPDPALPPPPAFLSKADGFKQAINGMRYPTKYEDLQGGGGSINGMRLGEYIPYYSVQGDGTDGYFKWILSFNWKNAKFWLPEPKPFNIATKYWRDGGYPNNSALQGYDNKNIGTSYTTVKDGMYTAGLCSEIEQLWIHTTGCGGKFNMNMATLRHTAGGMMKESRVSTMPYHWVINPVGHMSQEMPDARYGAHTGKYGNEKGVAISWMTYNNEFDGGIPAKIYEKTDKATFDSYRRLWPTNAQIINLGKLIAIYVKRYPNIKIAGHHQYKLKHCPNFWVPDFVRAGGVPGLNQAGIDKLVRTGGKNPAKDGDYGRHPDVDQYGPETIYGFAARELAKISNPAGIGGGSSPVPSSNPDTPKPQENKFKDMDCTEYTNLVKDLQKKGLLTGFMSGMKHEDRQEFEEKAYTCS